MQFTLPTLLLLSSALPALAAPASTTSAQVADWTVEKTTRTCNAANTSCDWSFGINTHVGATTACKLTVKGAGGKPASQTPTEGGVCGAFTIGTGWDGSFGAGNGFTVLSVKNYGANQIAWPSYTDRELVNGKAVTPDKSWHVQNIM